ncbi:MAG TPA: pyridine nucleotide-disulfide oxidoreductase [Clostridium sp.]|nr:pyridine nucleotide-disulfide oxidoreductase [Clostridium sp.]
MKTKYDVVIIGFGKAGKTLAAKLAKLGKSVALIEKDAKMYGGTCINVGCIPSKRLITDAANSPKGEFSAKAEYYKNTIEEKKKLTAALRKANYDKLAQAGVDVVDGAASFTDENHITVLTADGEFIIEGDKFIIGTGSVPVIPKIDGVENSQHVYVSETIMDLEELPHSLTIVGGGYIGLEFAFMYANFGSRVTIIQDGKEFLAREDEDVAECIKSVLKEKGVQIVTAANTTKIQNGTLYYECDGESKVLESDAILLATGRRPNTDGLGCEKAGIILNERGAIETDEHLRTGVKHIWAAGDVRGKLQFTYISLDDSRIILDDMIGNSIRTTNNRGAFSYSVFIEPPFARVGMNEKEAKAANVEYRAVSLPTNAIPKAKVLRETDGILKALIASDGTILGAELFCAESPEMINLIKLAMDNKIKAEVIRDFIFTHPTMSESLNDLFSL